MEKKSPQKKIRFHLIDEFRGFLLINMIAFHAIWDLVYIFGCDWQWFGSDGTFIWQQSVCWSFILVSGFCWQMSRHPLQRGLLVFGAGIVITLATLIFMPDSRVIFGVLTMIGSSMLLMIPCNKLFCKINPYLGAVGSFLLFLLVYPVNDGYLGIGETEIIALPVEWYNSMFSTYLGFPEPGFWSTDYFSILPWFFLYVTGYFGYSAYNRTKESAVGAKQTQLMSVSICPPLGWLGRNSLLIYMLHQPIVYGVLVLVYGL